MWLMSQLLIQKSLQNGSFLACRDGSAQGEHLRAQGVPGTTPVSQECLRAYGSAPLLSPGKIPTGWSGGQGQTLCRGCARGNAPILGLWGQGEFPGARGTQSHAGVMPDSPFPGTWHQHHQPPKLCKKGSVPLTTGHTGTVQGEVDLTRSSPPNS